MVSYQLRVETEEINQIKAWAALMGMSIKKFLLFAAKEKAERDLKLKATRDLK